jgi:hypothetical protein
MVIEEYGTAEMQFTNGIEMYIKQWLKNHIFIDGQIISNRLRLSWFENNYPDKLKEIIIDNNISIAENIYRIIHDIESATCLCGKSLSFISYKSGYSKYCSSKCANNDIVIREKIIVTCHQRYGGKSPANSLQVRNKMKATTLERFGVENAFQSERSKIKNTNLIKFGVENVAHSAEIKEKKKRTCLERYGSETPFHSGEIRQKIVSNNLKKYGVENFKQSHISVETLEKLKDAEWLIQKNSGDELGMMEISKELDVSPSTVFKACQKLGIEIHRSYSSRFEREICDFLSSLGVKFKSRDKSVISPYELDVYIPEYNLAIEFDGLFWHSYDRPETKEEKFRHLNKTLLCKDKNIQLFHIFENEWIDPVKQDILKSMISGKLNKNKKIYARKCEIKKVIEDRDFLNNNHLQGFVGSNIKLGLFCNDELVSLMTFGKPRYNKNYHYELIRFCNKKYYTIIGGASRLFKYFIDNYGPESIISYADLRYSVGNMYDKLNMRYIWTSGPNYFYIKGINLYPRTRFQKKLLSKVLENFDPSLSESQNMFNNGYRRIWDCGNAVYEWEL